jgi:hypothetical protein
MPHINGLSHPQDPDGASYVQSNVPLATMSIGSGMVAGTLAGVDAADPAMAALSHVTLPVSAFLAGIPIPGFTTLALLTQGSLDLWIFIFAFVSVGLAATNLYLGFWMRRREVSDYAKAYNIAEEELHKNEALTAQLTTMQEEYRKLRAQVAAQGGTSSPTGGLPNPQTDRPTHDDEHDHDHDHEPKAGVVFPRSVG